MRIIRWPIVSLALAILLLGFFLIGYVGSPYLRSNLETFASKTFDTPVMVESFDLNVYNSCVALENFKIVDPENKSKYLLTAKKIDFQADISSILKQNLILNYIDVNRLNLKLSQDQSGGLFLVKNADGKSSKETFLLNAKEIITWTSDKVDPIDILATLDGAESKIAPRKKNPEASRYKIEVDHNSPDLIIADLTLCNSQISFLPFEGIKAPSLNNLNAHIKNISSQPKKYKPPIDFDLHTFIENNTQAWLKAKGSIYFKNDKSNLLIDLELTNLVLKTWLPLAKVYTDYVDMLNVKSGQLSLTCHFEIKDGIITPTVLKLHFLDLTAETKGAGREIEWLKNLSFSEAEIDLTIPVNNKKPYFHIDQAIKQNGLEIKKVKNVELRFKKEDLLKNFMK